MHDHTPRGIGAVLAGTLLVLALALPGQAARADIVVRAPDIDVSALPSLPAPDADPNPYRGDAGVIDIGRSAFNQTCAQCHGVDADAHASPAPDLRRVGRGCRRVPEPELKLRCLADADHYFLTSVEDGKTKVGIEHMPAWKNVLSRQVIWAIRSFVESAGATRP